MIWCIYLTGQGEFAMGQGQYLNGRKILMAGRKILPSGYQPENASWWIWLMRKHLIE